MEIASAKDVDFVISGIENVGLSAYIKNDMDYMLIEREELPSPSTWGMVRKHFEREIKKDEIIISVGSSGVFYYAAIASKNKAKES